MAGTRLWGSTLSILALLGLLMASFGVIVTSMWFFGYSTIGSEGKHEVSYGEFKVNTSNGPFAFVIGGVMVLLAHRIPNSRGALRKVKEAEEATPFTLTLEEGGYTISEQDLWIDLRNRKEVGIIEYFGSGVSEAERAVKITLKVVKSGVKELNFHHATSGPGIEVVKKPDGANWRKIKSESKEVIYNPFTNLLKEKNLFKALLARKGKMRSYYMTVPITDGKGQEIWYRLKYRNGFQGREFEWAGKLFSADTDILKMNVMFPEDKPFKSIKTSKKETSAAPKFPFNNPEIEASSDNHTLTWTIRNAKKGEMYYIEWKW